MDSYPLIIVFSYLCSVLSISAIAIYCVEYEVFIIFHSFLRMVTSH